MAHIAKPMSAEHFKRFICTCRNKCLLSQKITKNKQNMSTASLNAELQYELGNIANDESSLRKVISYIRKLATKKATAETGYKPRTHDELVTDFKEACHEVKLYAEGKQSLPTWEEMMNEL